MCVAQVVIKEALMAGECLTAQDNPSVCSGPSTDMAGATSAVGNSTSNDIRVGSQFSSDSHVWAAKSLLPTHTTQKGYATFKPRAASVGFGRPTAAAKRVCPHRTRPASATHTQLQPSLATRGASCNGRKERCVDVSHVEFGTIPSDSDTGAGPH